MKNKSNPILRYSLALASVATAFFLRHGIVLLVGEELPPWITFYPTVMFVAMVAGLGPGILATITAALVADYFYFIPQGSFAIANISQLVSLALFSGMGVFMSVVAELYRRTRDRLEYLVVERTEELKRSNEELVREVDERKLAEETLRRQADLLRLSFDAIIVWRLNGGIESWNLGAELLYGFTEKEALGKTTHKLLATIYPEPWEQIEAGLCKKGFWEGELRHRTKDGREVIVSARHQLIHSDDGVELVLETNRDITERKRDEEAIKASLQEKEVLLKEVHHRVKNNLQVISSLIGLQADGSTDETVREVLRDVTYRVRSMALVHEKLYQSADLARIDFAGYARSLLGYIWRAHGSSAATVRLTLDLEPVSLPVDTAVPCGLILNELAGNALKHAFRGRDEGEVIVSLQGGIEGRIRLTVADNGVGLTAGFDWRQAKSLGLRLVQMLSGQIGASVEVSSGKGTRFDIVI